MMLLGLGILIGLTLHICYLEFRPSTQKIKTIDFLLANLDMEAVNKIKSGSKKDLDKRVYDYPLGKFLGGQAYLRVVFDYRDDPTYVFGETNV